jgi:flagellar biosynthesis/type III secretory pathway chaperone
MPERKLLDRIVKLRRDRADEASTAAASTDREERMERLEARVAHLERALEGLQDAVHRDSVRHDERIAELQRKTAPHSIAQALSEDARRRGI